MIGGNAVCARSAVMICEAHQNAAQNVGASLQDFEIQTEPYPVEEHFYAD